ncbi:MAG: hypothetical protein ABFS45_09675 [Pseudomonadota bacterium]
MPSPPFFLIIFDAAQKETHQLEQAIGKKRGPTPFSPNGEKFSDPKTTRID